MPREIAPVLVKLRRRQTGIETPLTDRMVVGRLKECQLAIGEASVSRRHARLEIREGKWWVVDLNSSNGISLNGQAAKEFQIHAGDLITFGAVAFDVLAIPKQAVDFEAEQIELESVTSLAAVEPSRADRERARLHRELRGSKASGGLGDLGQQSWWIQLLMVAVGLVVVVGVVYGVRWLMAMIAPTA